MNYFVKVEVNETTKKLTASESIVFSYLKSWHERYKDGYDKGIPQLIENMPFEICKRQMIRVLQSLETKGLITRKSLKNNITKFILIRTQTNSDKMPPGGDKMSLGVVTKCHQGGDKMSLGVVTKCHQGGDKMSLPTILIDHDRYTIDRDRVCIGDNATKCTPPENPKNTNNDFKNFKLAKPTKDQVTAYLIKKGLGRNRAIKEATLFIEYNDGKDWIGLNNQDWTTLVDRWFDRIKSNLNTNPNSNPNPTTQDQDLEAFFRMTSRDTGVPIEKVRDTYYANQKNPEETEQRRKDEIEQYNREINIK